MDCFPKELLHLIFNNININSLFKSKLVCKDTLIVANEIFCDIKFYIENKGILGLIKENFIHIEFAFKLKKFNNWNWGLGYACEGGYLDFVNLMIEKDAKGWNAGLYGACRGGYLDIINYMIEKGADDWNTGLVKVTWILLIICLALHSILIASVNFSLSLTKSSIAILSCNNLIHFV